MIRGVLFDLDGVLISTDDLHFASWKQMADEEGIYFDRQINERLRGVSRMESLEIVLERSPRSYSSEEKIALAERKNAAYRKSLQRLTRADLLAGSSELLAALRRRGIKTAIASSSKNAAFIVEQAGLLGEIDAIVDGNEISQSKPDPEVFLLAAERLQLSPEECVVVEDAVAGVEAAQRAGMRVIGIGTSESLPAASQVVGAVAEIRMDQLLGTD